MHEAILRVAEEQGVAIEALELADSHTRRKLANLRNDLALYPDALPGIAVVLTGSYARSEATDNSDCDYLLLLDQAPQDPRTLTRAADVVTTVTEGLRPPGQTGTFGDLAIVAELLARIGLEADTNVNTTRRLLLVFESVAIANDNIRVAAIRKLLARYCWDYNPASDRAAADGWRIPRFLFNDLTRYWRTMTVDFGAKQWRALRGDWYLRYAKLLTTRKVLFAGSAASLFMTREAIGDGPPGDVYGRLLSYLADQANMSPLARLMSAYDRVGREARDALGEALAAYEDFTDLMLQPTTRPLLAKWGNDPRRDSAMRRIDACSEQLQRSLEILFFGDDLFRSLTRRYGLF